MEEQPRSNWHTNSRHVTAAVQIGSRRVTTALLGVAMLASRGITCRSTARADGMSPLFGPKRYVRTTGRPNQVSDNFQNYETAAPATNGELPGDEQ